jgi:excisionase family DNA binding protein
MKLLTAKETAELLRVKPQWVYRMVRRGVLPGVRLGRQLRVDEDALKSWVADRTMFQNGKDRNVH